MKKYSQHQKPEDGENRKLTKPVICYPSDKIIIVPITIDRRVSYNGSVVVGRSGKVETT